MTTFLAEARTSKALEHSRATVWARQIKMGVFISFQSCEGDIFWNPTGFTQASFFDKNVPFSFESFLTGIACTFTFRTTVGFISMFTGLLRGGGCLCH